MPVQNTDVTNETEEKKLMNKYGCKLNHYTENCKGNTKILEPVGFFLATSSASYL